MRTSCVLLEVSEHIEFLPSFVRRMKSEERQVEVSLLLAASGRVVTGPLGYKQSGGIGSLESILGLLKSLKIRALMREAFPPPPCAA